MQCNVLLNRLRNARDEHAGPAGIDLHNVKSVLDLKSNLAISSRHRAHKCSTPLLGSGGVQISWVFQLVGKSFPGAQNRHQKVGSWSALTETINTSRSSSCSKEDWEWNGLTGSAEMRDGIIWGEKEAKMF